MNKLTLLLSTLLVAAIGVTATAYANYALGDEYIGIWRPDKVEPSGGQDASITIVRKEQRLFLSQYEGQVDEVIEGEVVFEDGILYTTAHSNQKNGAAWVEFGGYAIDDDSGRLVDGYQEYVRSDDSPWRTFVRAVNRRLR